MDLSQKSKALNPPTAFVPGNISSPIFPGFLEEDRLTRVVEVYACESTSGLAVLSSAPITHHWVNGLEPWSEDCERFSLSERIQFAAHLLTYTNVHLTHIAGGHALRRRQLGEVIECTTKMTAATAWFCCGDFNMPVNEPLRSRLGEETGLAVRDCYVDGGGTLPGTTLVNVNQTEERFRIDHLLYLHSPERAVARCSNSRRICNEPDFVGFFPSDHFGVCTDIVFLPPSPSAS